MGGHSIPITVMIWNRKQSILMSLAVNTGMILASEDSVSEKRLRMRSDLERIETPDEALKFTVTYIESGPDARRKWQWVRSCYRQQWDPNQLDLSDPEICAVYREWLDAHRDEVDPLRRFTTEERMAYNIRINGPRGELP